MSKDFSCQSNFITVDKQRNERMNKAALLRDKDSLDIPPYISGSERILKRKLINMNTTLFSQGFQARVINRILESSIKKALEIKQQQRRKQDHHIMMASKAVWKPYPKKITNLLFRQNIKNYNPYINALSELQDMHIAQDLKDTIRKTCYIGIARNYFQVKKYYLMPQYSRVGILIRTYMVDVMSNMLQQKAQNQPYTVYVKINPTALSFNAHDRPKELEQNITKKKYYDTISSINKIIVGEYQKYKKGNFSFVHGNFTYSETLLYALLVILVAAVYLWGNNDNYFLSLAVFFIILGVTIGGMALAWVQCRRNLSEVCAPKNITNMIEKRLNNYLQTINSEVLTWKLGPDFYWLQIQNIRVRKRKSQDAPDNS